MRHSRSLISDLRVSSVFVIYKCLRARFLQWRATVWRIRAYVPHKPVLVRRICNRHRCWYRGSGSGRIGRNRRWFRWVCRRDRDADRSGPGLVFVGVLKIAEQISEDDTFVLFLLGRLALPEEFAGRKMPRLHATLGTRAR